jgi:hypothetical protein
MGLLPSAEASGLEELYGGEGRVLEMVWALIFVATRGCTMHHL